MADYSSAAQSGKRGYNDVVAPKQAVRDDSDAVGIQAVTMGLQGATSMFNAAESAYVAKKKSDKLAAADELEAQMDAWDNEYAAELTNLNMKRASGQLSETALMNRTTELINKMNLKTGGLWGANSAATVAKNVIGSGMGKYLKEKTDLERVKFEEQEKAYNAGFLTDSQSEQEAAIGLELYRKTQSTAAALSHERNLIEQSDLDETSLKKALNKNLTKQGRLFLSEAEVTLYPRMQGVIAELEATGFSPESFSMAGRKLAGLKAELRSAMGKLTPEEGLDKGLQTRYDGLVELLDYYETSAKSGTLSSDLSAAKAYQQNQDVQEMLEQTPELKTLMTLKSALGESVLLDSEVSSHLAKILSASDQKNQAASEGREVVEKALEGIGSAETRQETFNNLSLMLEKGSEINPVTNQPYVPAEQRLSILEGTIDKVVSTYSDNAIEDRNALINWVGSEPMTKYLKENVGLLDEATLNTLDEQMTIDLSTRTLPKAREVLDQYFTDRGDGSKSLFSMKGDIDHVKLIWNGKKVVIVSERYDSEDLARPNAELSPVLSAYVRARSNLFSTRPSEVLENMSTVILPEASLIHEKTDVLVKQYEEQYKRVQEIPDAAQRYVAKRQLGYIKDTIRKRPNMSEWEYEAEAFDPKSLEGMSLEDKKTRLEELKKKATGG